MTTREEDSMRSRGHGHASGFHAGELAMQRRAGVEAEAARLTPMLAPAELRAGLAAFLAERTFAVLAARDSAGRLWASPLAGRAGFLTVTSPTTLRVRAPIWAGDPLHGLPPSQQAGLIAVEFATRRRFRLNGTLTETGTGTDDGQLSLDVDQAFGNCPQYIHRRVLETGGPETEPAPVARTGDALTAADTDLIRNADTFFLGTAHPGRGADVSHRGGPPGFVRVEGDQLWWPDYPGNNMFNSFGNLVVNPEAALLFIDFRTGDTLHLSGTATVEWGEPGAPGDDGGTGRRVRFTVQRVVAGHSRTARETA
jgi:predicted pyridoxine 5'-phosphate oxidase superfamily flavin-nucleotide-binding protein